ADWQQDDAGESEEKGQGRREHSVHCQPPQRPNAPAERKSSAAATAPRAVALRESSIAAAVCCSEWFGVPQFAAFFTSAPILASSAAVNSFSAKAVGHMAPSSRFASSLKPNVAYLVLNLCALWKKQTTLPSLAYAGIPYQVFGERAGALALM